MKIYLKVTTSHRSYGPVKNVTTIILTPKSLAANAIEINKIKIKKKI
jgi:hypothetical protein